MSKILFTSLLFWLTLQFAFAKTKLDWKDGQILLNSGELLIGNISYNSEFDIVSVSSNNSEGIKSYSAQKVASFNYYDEDYEVIRNFISLDYIHPSSYKSKLFFELVLNGELKLIRREIKLKQFYSLTTQSLDESFGGHVYYAYTGKKFINLKRFKKQILPILLANNYSKISDFMKERDVKLRSKQHQVMLIDYFNFLNDDKRSSMDYMFSLN